MWFLRVCHQVPHNRDDNLGLLSLVLFISTSQSYVFKYDNTVNVDFKGLLCLLVAMSWMESASFAVEYYSVNIPVCMPVCASSPNLLPLSSSSLALRIVFRPWPSRCSGFETVGILRCEDDSPTTNPQPEGPVCLSLLASRSKYVRHGWPYRQLRCRWHGFPLFWCTQGPTPG
jgi:hypothetical protein